MITDIGAFAVKLSNHGIFYLSHKDSGIHQIDEGGNHSKIIDDMRGLDWFNWEVIDDQIYYVRRNGDFRPHLYRFNLVTHEKTDLSKNNLNISHVYQGFSIDPKAGVIYATVNDFTQSDIKMLAGIIN